MKKKILISLLVIFLMALIISTMYLIDKKRIKDSNSLIFNNGEEDKEKAVLMREDKIVLNSDYRMKIIEYDVNTKEIQSELEELQKLKYPGEMNLSRALTVNVRSDISKNEYDELHDIFLLFDGNDRNFSITMSQGKEPLTDYIDSENEINYQYSLIDGNDVAILHNDKLDSVNKKVYYTCLLQYKDIYFVIETTNFMQEEVISLIKSIFECNMKKIFEEELNTDL